MGIKTNQKIPKGITKKLIASGAKPKRNIDKLVKGASVKTVSDPTLGVTPKASLQSAPENASDAAFRALAKDIGGMDREKVDFFLLTKKYKAEIDLKSERFYNRFNLSPGRFHILLILRCAENNSLSPSELADKTNVSRATMTQVLDALEKAHYVTRKAFPGDRRAMLIQISPEGLKIFDEQILPIFFKRCAGFSRRFSKAEMKNFTEMYEKISKNMSEYESE